MGPPEDGPPFDLNVLPGRFAPGFPVRPGPEVAPGLGPDGLEDDLAEDAGALEDLCSASELEFSMTV